MFALAPVLPARPAVRQQTRCYSQRISRRSTLASTGAAAMFGMTGGTVAASARTRSEIESVLEKPEWPAEFPLLPRDFQRYDETPDSKFYASPRFVTHIDDKAIKALTEWYRQHLPVSGLRDSAVLDMCSSWVSHYPMGYKAGRVVGLGMNEEELARNPVLTEALVQDLNENPKLPYADNSFDMITNSVSVDYLTKPLDVFREAHRVLKPGGIMACSFSNRCFPTKVISLWSMTGDMEHVWIVGSYFHYAVRGGFTPPQCNDISPQRNIPFSPATDPMYVVWARKTA